MRTSWNETQMFRPDYWHSQVRTGAFVADVYFFQGMIATKRLSLNLPQNRTWLNQVNRVDLGRKKLEIPNRLLFSIIR